MTPTIVKVTDPRHPMHGKELIVKMAHRDDNAVVANYGDRINYWLDADQFTWVSITEQNTFIEVSGHIPDLIRWDQIKGAIETIYGCRVGGGWTGPNGRMNISACKVGASSVLAQVQSAVDPWGLMATLPAAPGPGEVTGHA